MRKIIHRIDAPGITGIMMRHMCHTIDDRITHVHIRRRHINTGSQYLLAILILSVLHLGKDAQIFFDAAFPPRIVLARMLKISSGLTDLLRRQIRDISLSFFDQLHSTLIHAPEIVRRKEETVFIIRAEPLYILLNGFHELAFFLGRIRIVKTEIKLSAVFLCHTVVGQDRLCMPDV